MSLITDTECNLIAGHRRVVGSLHGLRVRRPRRVHHRQLLVQEVKGGIQARAKCCENLSKIYNAIHPTCQEVLNVKMLENLLVAGPQM